MKLFGKGKSSSSGIKSGGPAGATPKDAITKLRDTLEVLDKREKYLQTRVDAELQQARALASKNKRAALMALKKKKLLEGELDKVMGQRMTLETQMMTLENANVNLETLNAMKAGSAAMKTIHGTMDINKVDDTMDEIKEQMELANEISEAISNPVGFGTDVDQDELEAELDQLEQEELDAQLLNGRESSLADEFPSTPITFTASKSAVPENTEDDELRELGESMRI